MRPLFPQGSLGILYSHVQDNIYSGQTRECDKVSILILSLPFKSIHLSYCFRKLDSYSVQLHETIVLPRFKGTDSMSIYWLIIFSTNENAKKHHAKQF